MTDIYSKLPTLFKRGQDFNVNVNQFTWDEFDLVDRWIVTEKIDGMNICLNFDSDKYGHVSYNIWGRTKNAQIPIHLNDTLIDICYRNQSNIIDIMTKHDLQNLKLFGEGYGSKINGGGWYSDSQKFILFDVKANDRWLDENQITKTAADLNIDRVPIFGEMEIVDIVGLIKRPELCVSDIGNDAKPFEGIVARTRIPLYTRQGHRLAFKLKVSDFTHGVKNDLAT